MNKPFDQKYLFINIDPWLCCRCHKYNKAIKIDIKVSHKYTSNTITKKCSCCKLVSKVKRQMFSYKNVSIIKQKSVMIDVSGVGEQTLIIDDNGVKEQTVIRGKIVTMDDNGVRKYILK